MTGFDANVDVVRRLMGLVWGQGRFDLLPDLIAPDYVAHLPIGDHYGPEGCGSISPGTGRLSRI